MGARSPQTGADGNRQNRWLFPANHPFYADEKTATLTEVKYYLQTLSMQDAPSLPTAQLQNRFSQLLGHELAPGKFLDPLQKIPVSFAKFSQDLRYVESGHLVPLSRGGKHTPENSTLMLKDSNRLQGDFTVDEVVQLMKNTLEKHGFTVEGNP